MTEVHRLPKPDYFRVRYAQCVADGNQRKADYYRMRLKTMGITNITPDIMQLSENTLRICRDATDLPLSQVLPKRFWVEKLINDLVVDQRSMRDGFGADDIDVILYGHAIVELGQWLHRIE